MKIHVKNKNVMIVFVTGAMLLLVIFFFHENIQRFLQHFAYKCDREIKELKTAKTKLCSVNLIDRRTFFTSKQNLEMIYFVTPTYPRPEQVPELTRLAHTLMHVPRIHWIVADDQPLCSEQVSNILKRSKLPFTHMSSPKPYTYKCAAKPKGVANRRAALKWIAKHVHDGVLYFGDDDNTVDLQLFDEIRKTKKVAMFPVGLIGCYGVSSPIVKDGKVSAFFDSWPASRMFPVDMAGFALNIKRLNMFVRMPYLAGQEESIYLESLGLTVKDIEPLADNCSKVLVWHTKTHWNRQSTVNINVDQLREYPSLVKLLKEVHKQGISAPDPKALDIAKVERSVYGIRVKVVRLKPVGPTSIFY